MPVPAPSKGITFAAVGDVMMGTDYPDNILPDDDAVGFLSGVAPILSAADVAFGNLEGVLMDGGEAVKRCKPAKKKSEPAKNSPLSTPTSPPSSTGQTPSAPAQPESVPTAPQNSAQPPESSPTQPPSTPAQPTNAQPAAPDKAASPAEESGEGAPASPPPKDAAGGDRSTDEQTPAAASKAPAASTVPPGQTSPPQPPASSQQTASSQQPASPPPQQSNQESAPGQPPSASEQSAVRSPQTPQSASVPPPAVQQPATAGSCYVFRSPTRYATYLRDAGFDVMSLANNHAQDFGDPGRDSSMRALDDVGIRHSGRDGDVAEWTTQGRRFALVAFAPNIGSHQLNDLTRAREIVSGLASRHDIVVVSFHGGSEGEGASTLPFTHEIYQGEDRGDVVEFAHAVVDAGADLVLGSGPHVLRAMELYRERLIAYSLGNFATYYGISVNGIRGIAGVLTTRLADDGKFLDARLDSTVQIRPAGPTLDPERRAVTQLRDLTTTAFPTGRLEIEDDGHIVPSH